MLTSRIITCLDVADGKVIRGVKFSADRVVGDPVELAAEYNRQGADELVFYDITASAENRGLIVFTVFCLRQDHSRRQNVLRIESDIDASQAKETLNHQSRPDE